MYLVKTPNIIQRVYKQYVWSIPNEDNSVFLSFDDGPNPKTTPQILQILDEYDSKACFFCVGKNIEKYPDLFKEIKRRGHSVGNHSYSHLSGWSTKNEVYVKDVMRGAISVNSSLFRPPYGRIRANQARLISKSHQIVMWDVMSGDFDLSLSAEDCFKNVASKTKSGSIVVMHDNLKAREKISVLLPMILDFYAEKAFSTKALTQNDLIS